MSRRLLPPMITGALLLLAWLALHAALPASQQFLLPTPGRIFTEAVARAPELATATAWTATAAIGGFVLAATVAIGFSLLLASSRLVRAALYPYVMLLQMVPIIIIAPILILWVGPGLPSVIIVTFLISFFPMVVNNTQGLLSADQNLVDLFRVGKATPWQQLRLLRIPSALPYFFAGLRIAAVLAPIGALTGDYLVGTTSGGNAGLGITAMICSTRSEIPALYATAFIACALGWLFVGAVSAAGWAALHRWHDSYNHTRIDA
ncbi:MAG: ABC transporter permease subunit [Verrucomicrobiota bacterium]